MHTHTHTHTVKPLFLSFQFQRHLRTQTSTKMEFACSHVVCNWRSDRQSTSQVTQRYYDNVSAVKQETDPPPPPLPPRRLRKGRPTSLPPPPPLPPRADKPEEDNPLSANVNVVSISVGKLVDISQASILGQLSVPSELLGNDVENSVGDSRSRVCVGRLTGVRSDDVYLLNHTDDDYQNLEDTLVVFCVDISGSMSVTTEVTSSSGSTAYISRLEGIQDALQRALSSLLQESPRRRVALVTFNDEVVIYGDGTSTPLTLRDWALVDYDHIWQQGVAYSIPHCIAETYQQLLQRVKDLREHGATCLGPAALAAVAMASRYPGSKVILCTDGKANIGLGEMTQTASVSLSSPLDSYFYKQLSVQAVQSGVIVSVLTFEGTDCRLAEVGRLADTTGGRVNIVTIGTIATEIQLASMDNVLATGAELTLLAADGICFPFEEENGHKLVRDIGNVTEGLEITFQFDVKPQYLEDFVQRSTLPFQLQLTFKTRDQQRVTRIITEQRPVTTSSQIWAGSLSMAVLGVHCAQLCARLTMEGRVQDAQRELRAQQDLLQRISQQKPIQQEENIYGNWMDTMTTICDDIATESQTLSDEAAKVVYQMKRASSATNRTTEGPRPADRRKKALMEAI
ncbi:circularly permutated Ras protein 1-like [Sphaeramia orbicularis]|uniref:circularly permutated Ras protein 1-like n=1 Tax=Sphaeramia orbicularis TaxID=375764 RepID=UPI00117F04DD|nr:circularly permutated Ras protein 1-like [Sphaeramia orbicularis]